MISRAPNHTRWAAIKNANTIEEHRSKTNRNNVFDCHLSPVTRQMEIKNTVSIDFWSAFVDCWLRFRLPPTRCANGCDYHHVELNSLHAGKFVCFFLSSAFFPQNQLLWKILSGIPSECQTVWIQIRLDVLSGLIWCPNCLQGLSADDSSRQIVCLTIIEKSWLLNFSEIL